MNWSVLVTRKRLGAIVFLGLSLFYGAQIPDIPRLPVDALEAMNARSMPWVLAGAGVLLSIALFVFGGKPESRGDAAVASANPHHVLTALLLFGWTGLYGALLEWVGFFLATLMFLIGGFLLLGERRGRVIAGTALVAAGVLFLVLRFGLGLYLPQGSLWVLVSPNV